MNKKVAQWMDRIKGYPGLEEDERYMFAAVSRQPPTNDGNGCKKLSTRSTCTRALREGNTVSNRRNGRGRAASVPVVTLDTDIWVNLDSRQYMRVMNLCLQDGATMLSKTVAELKGGHLVNFLYEVHGINGFAYEYGRVERIKWL